ncbi:MAG: acyl carrier protein [Proteobacteria bacterium]|nr:acyl carrier protein [Pseudomonadota bacterium]HQR03538.1 phosphopantetheine-binding protein [Rhodocyclaceae bacterium]
MKIKEILNTEFGIDAEQITAEATMRDLGVDSMHVVYVMLDLEKALDVKIPLEELNLPKQVTVRAVAETIAQHLVAPK